MADLNTMSVQPAKMTVMRSSTVATGIKLATLQRVVMAISGAPTFAAAAEPLLDGQAYVDVTGKAYYRPQLVVARRGPGQRPGPDVWFMADDDGSVAISWTLAAEALGGNPDAIPLPINVTAVTMAWAGGSRSFDPPSVALPDVGGPGQPAFVLHGGARLTRDEAARLEFAMNHPEPACRLDVTYTYEYNVQVAVDTRPDPPDPPEDDPRGPRGPRWPRPWDGPGGGRVLPQFRALGIKRPLESTDEVGLTGFEAAKGLRAAAASNVFRSAEDVSAPAAAFTTAIQLAAPALSRRVDPAVIHVIRDRVKLPTTTSEQGRTQTVVRSIPFSFPAIEEANGPIYRSLHGAANLGERWRLGAAGWASDSVFPNTVNRLPDALRLAWDAELRGPHLVPTLHRDSSGNPRVRLLLRLAPYSDPRKRMELRRLVGLPAASIVIGDVQSSQLRLAGSFPEELAVIGDGGAPAPLTGLDLTLDLSLAFYQLFCRQIATPIGVPGTITVVLDTPAPTEGAAPIPQETNVEVVLRLDRPDDLPCSITLPAEAAPTTVTVHNDSGTDIEIGGAGVVLLQLDEESAVPVDTVAGRCTSSFPVRVAAGGTTDLTIEPDPEDAGAAGFVWNAVLVELLDKRLVITPDALLTQVNELAGTTDVSHDVTVSSPVFAQPTMPTKWANLANLEVEVTPAGGTPVTVVLDLAHPSRVVPAAIRLNDVASGGALVATVSYRVRNNFFDSQGDWGAPRTTSGDTVIAFPNPI